MVWVEAIVFIAGKSGCQVESKTVDLHLVRPVAQRVNDKFDNLRVREVERVAAAGGVVIIAEVVLAVVAAGIYASVTESQATSSALGGVVVNHVEQNLDAVAMQFTNRGLDLGEYCLRPGLNSALARIAVVRGKEVDRVVAPVIKKPRV